MSFKRSNILEDKILFMSRLGQSSYAQMVKMTIEGNTPEDTEGVMKPYSKKVKPKYEDDEKDGDYIEVEKTDYESEIDYSITAQVAVYPLCDVVSKYGTWWSMGTEGILEAILENDRMPDIVAHVIDINSPGGEAYYTGVVAEAIRNEVKKPIYAHVNGLCCSAAMYIASATDGIFCSESTDIIGSIGTMLSMIDMKPMFEEMGIKFHEIYADQSSEKNQLSIKAIEGDYTPIKEKLLNPFAASFIQSVQAYRPNLQDDGHVFNGAEYIASEAQKIGLIDGIMTLEKVIAYAATKGVKSQESKFVNSKTKNSMSFLKNLASGFKGQVDAEEVKASIEIASQLDALTAQISSLTAQLTASTTELTRLNTELTNLQAASATLQADNAAIQAELDIEKAKPRAAALNVPTPAEGEKVVSEKLKAAADNFAKAMGN